MKNVALKILMLAMASAFLSGCGKSSNKYTDELNELKNYKQPADTDVTQSPKYNFSSFFGTVWKTKVKTALINVKQYTGRQVVGLFPPETFDPTNPAYRPIEGMRIITVLPVGTRLRIERLMKDNGIGDLLLVTATLKNGTNSQETGYVDPRLLAKNQFLWSPSSSTNWGVNPDMLAKP